MTDWSQRSVTRRTLLRGMTGLAAASAIGPLTRMLVPPAEAGAAVTLSMWGNHAEWKAVMETILAAFTSSHPGIQVEFDPKPNDQYQAVLNTAMSGGSGPDVIGFFPGTPIRDAAKAGQIVDLTGKVPIDDLIPAARNSVEFGGKVWGCPLAAYSVGIFYQRPIFQKYGIAPPKTWADLRAVSKKLKDAGQVPWSMPAKDGIIPYFFYTMAATSILGAGGFKGLLEGRRKLTEPSLLPAAQLLLDFVPYYNEGFQAVPYAEGKALFAQGRTAMIIGGSADYTGYKQVNPNVDVSVFGFPAPSGGPTVTVTGMELLYGANAASKNRDQAAQLVAWLGTKDAQQIVADKLARPIRKGVVPGNDPVAEAMIRAGQVDVSAWYDLPPAAGTLDVFLKEGAGIFTGRLSAADLAGKVQDAIKTSP
jgi:ABC-type glycerol-3-phosphate transport system substrate-binding protein